MAEETSLCLHVVLESGFYNFSSASNPLVVTQWPQEKAQTP